jgi:hypothetical protein
MTTKLTFGLLLSLGVATTAFAQTGRVGVNTDTPKTTFDVNGKKDGSGNLLTTDVTGMQAPRLTRAELTAKGDFLYGADQKGALVYITDVTAGDALTQRINITAAGYYYFDGMVWQKMSGSGAASGLVVKRVAMNTLTAGANGVYTITDTDLPTNAALPILVSYEDAAGPVAPVEPVAPVAPVGPAAPVAPAGPVAPVVPTTTVTLAFGYA